VGYCKSGTSCECTIHSSVSCWRIGCVQNKVWPRCVYGGNYHLQLQSANTSWLLHLCPHVCWKLTASKPRDRFGWNLLQQNYIKFCRVILTLISCYSALYADCSLSWNLYNRFWYDMHDVCITNVTSTSVHVIFSHFNFHVGCSFPAASLGWTKAVKETLFKLDRWSSNCKTNYH